MSAGDLLKRMPEAFQPEAAGDTDCTVQFNISTPTYAVIKEGTCSVSEGTADSADSARFLVDLVNDDVSKARKVVLEVGGTHLAIVHPKRFDTLRRFEYDELIGWRSNQAGFFWYISHVLPEEGGSFDEQWSVATDEGATIAAIVDAATTQEASKRESMRESAREAEDEEEEGEAPPDLEGMTEKV